jgi:hypothetical protein
MAVLAFFLIFQCNQFVKNAEKGGRSLLIAILAKYNCGMAINVRLQVLALGTLKGTVVVD